MSNLIGLFGNIDEKRVRDMLDYDFLTDTGYSLLSRIGVSAGKDVQIKESSLKYMLRRHNNSVIPRKAYLDTESDIQLTEESDMLLHGARRHMPKKDKYFWKNILNNSQNGLNISIGNGTKIDEYVIIGNCTTIGDECNIGYRVNVQPGTTIGNTVTIKPMALICIDSDIGDMCNIGEKAIVIPRVSIPERTNISPKAIYKQNTDNVIYFLSLYRNP